MGQYREITKEVIIPSKGSIRVWDAPTASPIKDITVVVNSGGGRYLATTSVASAAIVSNLVHQVFYGGQWEGTPFDADSTHTGGVAQYISAGFTAGPEIAQLIYEDSSILPTNRVGSTVQHNMKKYGWPIVLELSNATAADVTLYVTFVSESLAENV